MNEWYAEQKKLHDKCWFPWHMSYNGYIALVLPKRGRFIWNYWGKHANPNHGRLVWQPEYRRKLSDIPRIPRR